MLSQVFLGVNSWSNAGTGVICETWAVQAAVIPVRPLREESTRRGSRYPEGTPRGCSAVRRLIYQFHRIRGHHVRWACDVKTELTSGQGAIVPIQFTDFAAKPKIWR